MSPSSEQILAALLESFPAAVVLLDPDGRITLFNSGCEALTGYRRAEAMGRRPTDFLVPEPWRERVQRHCDALLAGEGRTPHEYPWRTKAGEERLMLWRCTALRLGPAGPAHALGIGIDVTEQRRLEVAARAKSRLLEHFFASTLDCVALLDRDFNFIRVNEAYARACQRPVEDFPGHNHFEFYPSDAKAIFEEVVRTGRPFTVQARPFEFPDHPEWGVSYWDWTLVPVLDDRGEIEALLFCLNDVTERKHAEQGLNAALDGLRTLSKELVEVQEQERRRIARELHDEIGQGLTVLKLTLERCRGTEAAGPLLQQALAVTNELVHGVRRIAFDLRPSMLDDLGLLSALLWLFERHRTQTGLDIHFRHNKTLGERLDPALETAVFRVAQEALTNIIRHAAVAQVQVTLWLTDQTVLLRVEDGGRGFDAATAEAGSGLRGMRERARMLDGELTIDSAVGAGTVVTLELPRRRPGSTASGVA